jgi:hypothetical protein
MVILFGSVLVPLVIFFALPLAAIGAFVTALPVAVIAAGMWIRPLRDRPAGPGPALHAGRVRHQPVPGAQATMVRINVVADYIRQARGPSS